MEDKRFICNFNFAISIENIHDWNLNTEITEVILDFYYTFISNQQN